MGNAKPTFGKRLRPAPLGHFREPNQSFIPLTDELLESTAWLSLSATERLILIDMIRQFYRASNSDTASLKSEGFAYTYSTCGVGCAEMTFTKARKAIAERQFFVAPPEIQSTRGDDAIRWVPSRKWRQYSDPKTAARLKKADKEKQKLLRRHKQRKLEHRKQRQANSEKTKVAPKNYRDTIPQKLEGQSFPQPRPYHKNYRDRTAENGQSIPQKL